MGEIAKQALKESMIYHAAWLLPIILGLVAVYHVVQSNDTSKRSGYLAFSWAVGIILVGYVGMYSNWLLLQAQVTGSSDIDWPAIRAGILRTSVPAGVGIVTVVVLFIVATALRRRDLAAYTP